MTECEESELEQEIRKLPGKEEEGKQEENVVRPVGQNVAEAKAEIFRDDAGGCG